MMKCVALIVKAPGAFIVTGRGRCSYAAPQHPAGTVMAKAAFIAVSPDGPASRENTKNSHQYGYRLQYSPVRVSLLAEPVL